MIAYIENLNPRYNAALGRREDFQRQIALHESQIRELVAESREETKEIEYLESELRFEGDSGNDS